MENNQVENQVDNQNEKNISCNIFLEQLELLNQLPENERGNVLYMAVLKAFASTVNQLDNQDDIQVENQLENAYISISNSLSLSILSNTVLNLLNKTIKCKIYKSNWGGKRQGAGKPKEGLKKKAEIPTKEQILDFAHNQLGKRMDDVNEFIEWWNSADWLDKDGFPVNWKHKVQSWINRRTQAKTTKTTPSVPRYKTY